MARPLKYKDVKSLDKHIEGYFKDAEAKGRPLTISGLALALGTTRQTLLEYEQRDEFIDTIKRAKLRIENWTEEQLFTSPRTAGVIFNLTNNFSWTNKQREKNEANPWSGWVELMKEADKVLQENGESI
jgi:hypothetical protein